MAKLAILLGQHLDRQPRTVVTKATTCWEAILAHVELQESGLGVNLPVKVCYVPTCLHEQSLANILLKCQLASRYILHDIFYKQWNLARYCMNRADRFSQAKDE